MQEIYDSSVSTRNSCRCSKTCRKTLKSINRILMKKYACKEFCENEIPWELRKSHECGEQMLQMCMTSLAMFIDLSELCKQTDARPVMHDGSTIDNNNTRQHRLEIRYRLVRTIDYCPVSSMRKTNFWVIVVIMLSQGSRSIVLLASNLGKKRQFQRTTTSRLSMQTFDDVISSPKSKTAKLVQNLLTKYVRTLRPML